MATTTPPVVNTLPEPLHRGQKLSWNYTMNLIGEKVCDPDIHICEICDLPILIYGRMLPCKHVFCYDCAMKKDKTCPRCKDAVNRIERCELGTIFLCTWGAPRYSHDGCRRTYLSQRDLQAHINHRHVQQAQKNSSSICAAAPAPALQLVGQQQSASAVSNIPAPASVISGLPAVGVLSGSASSSKMQVNPAEACQQISMPVVAVPSPTMYSAPPVRHNQQPPVVAASQPPLHQPTPSQQQQQQRGGSRGNLITIQLQGYSMAKNDRNRPVPQPKHLFR